MKSAGYISLVSLIVCATILLADVDRYLRHARSQYEQKNFITASQSYLKAIQSAKGEFTSADFYQLAISLKETKKFSEAIPYFETAIMKNHEKSSAILFEIACMYSLVKNEKMGQKYLRLAVNHDSSQLKNLSGEKNLEFLRSQQGWAGFQESLKSISAKNFINDDIYSILSFAGKDKGNEMNTWLCSNGRAVQTRKLGSCNKGFVMGKWELFMGRLNFTYDKECVYQGIGNKTKSTGTGDSMTCDGFDYQHYMPRCGGSSEVLYLAAHTIADARGGEKPEVGLFNTKFNVQFKPMAKDPKQCDPNFKPEKIEDMKVE